MLGRATASMTLNVYADLFDEDQVGVADTLDAAIRCSADGREIIGRSQCSDLVTLGGAKGIRTRAVPAEIAAELRVMSRTLLDRSFVACGYASACYAT
jgi:hypothetical protein